MKRLLMILLGSTAAFANACVSVASGGPWNAAATWTSCGGTVPQTTDTVTITVTAGNTVSCPGSTTCNYASYTISDTASATPALDVSGTLVKSGTTNDAVGNVVIKFEPGSVFQYTGATDAGLVYNTAFSQGVRQILAPGSDYGGHITIKNTGAGHYYFSGSASGNDELFFNGSYVDFQSCGNATNDCLYFNPQNSTQIQSCQHCTFDGASGAVAFKTAPPAGGGWDFEDSQFLQTSAKVRGGVAAPLALACSASPTGARKVYKNYFAKQPSICGNASDFQNNIFLRGFTTPGTATAQWNFTNNFVGCGSYCASYMLLDGAATNSFFLGMPDYDLGDASAVKTSTVSSATSTTLVDSFTANAYNATGSTVYFVELTSGAGIGQRRAILSNTATTITLAQAWSTTPSAGDSYVIALDVANIHFTKGAAGVVGTSMNWTGNVWQFAGTDDQGDSRGANGTSAVNITNEIMLPNAANQSSFTISSNLADTGLLNLSHNTWHVGSQGLNVSEGTQTATAGTLQTFRDNIAWSFATTQWNHGGTCGGGTNGCFVYQCAGQTISTCTSGYGVATGMDYNDAFNLITGYAKSSLGATGIGYQINTGTGGQPGLHDKQVDPQFVDNTRSFWKWATQTDCASASTTIHGQIQDGLTCLKNNPMLVQYSLIPYIRAGFIPTNTALKAAAHDGTDIGAYTFVNVNAIKPVAGFPMQVLPGSLRHLSFKVTNGSTQKLNYSISGTGGATATLSCTSNCNPWVDVTVGTGTGTCSISGVQGLLEYGGYTLSSTATLTLTATAVDETTVTDTVNMVVCAKTTKVWVTPAYRVLYKSQKVDLQSWITGNSNTNVTWAITTQPGGGNGTLSDTTNRDTVFSASVTGKYVVTATSVDDGTKSETAELYVTANTAPYVLTQSNTEPFDCSADPNRTGTTYQVGPSHTYHTINAVPWNTLTAGSLVQIFNENTGTSPTTYNEYFQIFPAGTKAQPVRVCGVPNASGYLPIVNAAGGTTASYVNAYAAAGYGAVSMIGGYSKFTTGTADMNNYIGPSWVTVSGLHIKGAAHANTYTPPGGGAAVNWVAGASCINIRGGVYLDLSGNEIEGCDNGTFSDFNSSNGWGGLNAAHIWEGNWIHNNSDNGGFDHQLYIQSRLQTVQFNRIDGMVSGGAGSNYKDRGISVFRYNYLGDGPGTAGPQRVLDIIDFQDDTEYYEVNAGGGSGATYLNGYGTSYNNYTCTGSWWCLGDQMGADTLAGWTEVMHQPYDIYGNVFQNSVALAAIHYDADHAAGTGKRNAPMYAYDNTFNLTGGSGIVVDNDNNGGGVIFEPPPINLQNNIIWTNSASFCWYKANMNVFNFTTNMTSSILNGITTPITGVHCNTPSDWETSIGQDIYGASLLSPADNHISGLTAGNFIQQTSQPFNNTTYVPSVIQSGMTLPAAVSNLPVRFMPQPSVWTPYVARNTPVTGVAAGSIGALDTGVSCSISVSPSTVSININGQVTFTASCGGTLPALTWSSTNTAVANPSCGTGATCVVTGIGVGTTTITASGSGATSGSASLTVTALSNSSLNYAGGTVVK